MVKRFKKIMEAVNNTLKETKVCNKYKFKDLVVNESELNLIKEFVDVFWCYNEAITNLSGQRYETASLIIFAFQSIKEYLNKPLKPLQKIGRDSSYRQNLKNAITKSFEYYLEKYGYLKNENLIAITFLDARFKTFYSNSSSEEKEACINTAINYIKA